MDSREDYSYGWNAQGNRFYVLKSGIRQGRVNMIAAYCEGELLAPFTVEGSCNRTVFETWLETCLIPTLKVGQIVIADNATFHKGGRILQLIEAAGCQLKYLPPYSPDLNKIERCWSWLKSRIRKQLIKFDSRAGCNGSCASHSGLTALAVAIALLLPLEPASFIAPLSPPELPSTQPGREYATTTLRKPGFIARHCAILSR